MTSQDAITFRALRTLDFGLHNRINSIAINGLLLAVCDAKGLIVVYNIETNKIIMKVVAPDEVLCLEWMDSYGAPGFTPLIFGTITGQINCIFKNEVCDIVYTGTNALHYSIQQVSYKPDTNVLAIAGGPTTQVWSLNPSMGSWEKLSVISCPVASDEHEIVVTGLFWSPLKEMLLVSYLYHGVWSFIYDEEWNFKVDWSMRLDICGFMTPSSKRDVILVHDIKNGYSVLSIPSGKLQMSFSHPRLCLTYCFPALWLDKAETVIITGGTEGKARLWNASTGRFIQTLLHEGKVLLLSPPL
ncbi:hypothetical protein QCA50_019435 [Cerrena zonata]|uniref:Uncharacterized protein n=1 Tax=Cerrena zonata TaxID=2478898 RepID=A0AAW0FE00_9APHY